MNIDIRSFLSINKAAFSINKGISVIAGKNGCGKSHLLLAIAQTDSETDILKDYGFYEKYRKTDSFVEITPKPELILYRPAIRVMKDTNEDFAYSKPLNSIINSVGRIGYVSKVEKRFQNLYSILSNFFIAGTSKNADEEIRKRWDILVKLFFEIFNLEICAETNIFNGTKVGIKLSNGLISPLTTLSTGELEILSLLSDLLLEYEFSEIELDMNPSSINQRKISGDNRKLLKSNMILIDELDAHFHPELQRKIIEKIEFLCRNKYVIITTHSPSVMLSVSSQNLFYMQPSTGSDENQVIKIEDDVFLYNSLSEMYKGFVGDIKIANHLKTGNNNLILRYTQECLQPSSVVAGDSQKDFDPQISSIRNTVSANFPKVIVEVGAGRGRLLTAFKGFDENFLQLVEYYAIEPNTSLHEDIMQMADSLLIKKQLSKFKILNSAEQCPKYNLCIMANLIHEIQPSELAQFFNEYIQRSSQLGTIIILEVAELGVGEKDFTMFTPSSIEVLFAPYKEHCSFNKVTHHSPRGLRLYDISIKINSPEFKLTNNDVVNALKKVIEEETDIILEKGLSALSYAFHVHNLAYATANLLKLDNSLLIPEG